MVLFGINKEAKASMYNQGETMEAIKNNFYFASSDVAEFEVEILDSHKPDFDPNGSVKVRCLDDNEVLILNGHLWIFEPIENE